MTKFVDEAFAQFMKEQGLSGFDDLWKQSMDLVEEGNYREKGSQSEVSRWHHAYVKKQQNYTTKLSRWLKPKAVCAREFENIIAWQKLDIPTLEVLYFHQEALARRAILVTKALDGYQSLESWLQQTSNLNIRAKVFARVATILSNIHSKGWHHRCFFPKHIYVNTANPEMVRIIDLEKARKQRIIKRNDMIDITPFYRRCAWANPKEGLQFMKAYWGVSKFENKHRLMLKQLENRLQVKQSRRDKKQAQTCA